MKIKCQHRDFSVREIVDIPTQRGPYTLYRLHKTGLGTLEALAAIRQVWPVSEADIAYAGLKDRHATTSQMITIRGGPKKDLEQTSFSLRFVGHTATRISAKNLIGNEFEIRMRDVEPGLAGNLLALAELPLPMLPNYFDQQRFGSVGLNGQFVASAWCQGNYERAIYLALAEENKHDDAVEREEKAILRQHWGDWQLCKDRLARSNRRSVVTYLVDHPTGFKKAAALIRRSLRSLYVAAFQARLWNETVSHWLVQTPGVTEGQFLTPTSNVPTPGRLFFPMETDRGIHQQLARAKVPLPSSRPTHWPADIKRILKDVCGQFGLQVHQLRFSHPRDVFFSRAPRDVLIKSRQFDIATPADIPLEENPRQLLVRFRLDPGQYATMLLKGLELWAKTTGNDHRHFGEAQR